MLTWLELEKHIEKVIVETINEQIDYHGLKLKELVGEASLER